MIRATNIIFTGGIPVGARGQNKLFKVAMHFGLRIWHGEILKLHFLMSAYKTYKYQRRVLKYIRKKERKLGHNLPIVWTGNTQELAQSFIRTSGTAQKATGTMNVPWYIRNKPIRVGLPVLGNEMVSVTSREMDELAKQIANEFVAQVDENKVVRNIRIR